MLDYDSFMAFVRQEAAQGTEYRTRRDGKRFTFSTQGRGLSFVPETGFPRYESPKYIATFLDRFLAGARTASGVGETRNSSYLFALAEAWLEAHGAGPFELAMDEPPTPEALREGRRFERVVKAYERSRQARDACVAVFGTACSICQFDFGQRYGPDAAGFIHVHHLNPMALARGERTVDPARDLRPVCPNCHAVIHLGGGCRSIEEVREMLSRNAISTAVTA